MYSLSKIKIFIRLYILLTFFFICLLLSVWQFLLFIKDKKLKQEVFSDNQTASYPILNDYFERNKSLGTFNNVNNLFWKTIIIKGSYQNNKVFLVKEKKNGFSNNENGFWLVNLLKIDNTDYFIPVVQGWKDYNVTEREILSQYKPNELICKNKNLIVIGRLFPSESPKIIKGENNNIDKVFFSISNAQLINTWQDSIYYPGFIILEENICNNKTIDLRSPSILKINTLKINIHSIFQHNSFIHLTYSIEWFLFAILIIKIMHSIYSKGKI